ncbi:uncharacterized protein LOC110988218 [Acanthaster planci]|uniref:Uncharacterized protein LOC110988218 n=1 Tax=Acanthaster planci TaxID=133434 RepID=A0A8B7ZUP7_ACAPL|nr:uncharacterized protein LOC110988218 [Acanthaster planci]
MASHIVFFLSLATTVGITISATIEPESSTVTVQRGQQLRLSFKIGISRDENITESQWVRTESQDPYDTVDVSTCIPDEDVPCITSITVDQRGKVKYLFVDDALAITTLIIDESTLGDNTTFRCRIEREQPRGAQISLPIYVTVHYLPNETYPVCTSSNLTEAPQPPPVLTCSAGESHPAVLLEWTTLDGNSDRITLSNDTERLEDRVQNTLNLSSLSTPYNNQTFTCFMTSEAYPDFSSNCSIGPIGPIVVSTAEPTTGATQVLETHPMVTDEAVSTLSPIEVIAATAGAGAAFFVTIAVIVCIASSGKAKPRRRKPAAYHMPVYSRHQADAVRPASSDPANVNQSSDTLTVTHGLPNDSVPLEENTPRERPPAALPRTSPDVYAYASIAPDRQRHLSPPDVFLDSDPAPQKTRSEGYAYASVLETERQRPASFSSLETDKKTGQEPARPQTRDTNSTSPAMGQTPRAASTKARGSSNESGGNDAASGTGFVDNILYIPSTEDVVTRRTSKKLPRLDPF